MDIDHLLQDRLQLLLAHMKIHFQLQEVLRDTSVHESQVLGQDLIEQESSQGGLHIARYGLSGPILLRHPDSDPGMQGTCLILISQDGFIHALEELAFSHGTGSLLGKVVDSQHHVLGRNRHRTSIGGL